MSARLNPAAATSQFLNAQDSLAEGSSTTAQAALSGQSQASADIARLSNEDLSDDQETAILGGNDQADSSDSTSLSSTLVMPSGSTVSVYAAADETFTTIDTSTGSSVSIPGESEADTLFNFSTTGGSPQLTGYVDADTALSAVSDGAQQTAYSAALDTGTTSGAPGTVAADSAGNCTIGSDSTSAPCISNTGGGRSGGYYCPNRGNEVSWALAHSYPAPQRDKNGYSDDCTDFVSRSLNYGGGLPQDTPASPLLQHRNTKYWFLDLEADPRVASYTWGDALDLAKFFVGQGSYFLGFASNSKTGDIIFASWKGQGFDRISHLGVITAVNGHNVYITQHSNNRKNEALFRESGRISWFQGNPHMQYWIAVPSRKA
ncbi:MAG: amidase domain-containing protein [Actinomycetota bacterium]|nr:amidase domain-containing protein [Actinomycetota bacterium]